MNVFIISRLFSRSIVLATVSTARNFSGSVFKTTAAASVRADHMSFPVHESIAFSFLSPLKISIQVEEFTKTNSSTGLAGETPGGPGIPGGPV